MSTRSTPTVSLVLKWLAPLLVILRTVSLCLDTFIDQCLMWAGKPVRMRIAKRAQNYSRLMLRILGERTVTVRMIARVLRMQNFTRCVSYTIADCQRPARRPY